MISIDGIYQQTLGLTAEDYSRLQQATVVPVVPVEKDIFCAALVMGTGKPGEKIGTGLINLNPHQRNRKVETLRDLA